MAQRQAIMVNISIDYRSLTAAVVALVIVRQLPRNFFDGPNVPVLADAFQFMLPLLLVYGTSFFAWHVAAVSQPVFIRGYYLPGWSVKYILATAGIVGLSATLLSMGTVKTALLLGAIGACWILGLVATPWSVKELGYKLLVKMLAANFVYFHLKQQLS
ncbi:MAG: hypothetical protein M1820_003978 [Bogoriella megaspora]|nr:MAG: hypothetical protein M1820_003978 [Bogoriella megaspora]